MVSKSVYDADVRVRREAETLTNAGYQVTVVCLGPSESPPSGVRVLGLGSLTGLRGHRQVGSTMFQRAARWLLLPNHRRQANQEFAAGVKRAVEHHDLDPDVIHAHDFPALEASAPLLSDDRRRLVYDSHEYWRGMARYGRPDAIASVRDRRREQRLASRADAVVTVSTGAAELLEKAFGVADIKVVRNTFPIRTRLTAPESPSGAVYAGRIGRGRDLETIFASQIWEEPHLSLHLIGPLDETFAVPSEATVHPASSMDQVDELLVKEGISLVPLSRGPVNHEVALPNKLFQALSVGVPVLAAALPEMAKLVERHGLGLTYQPGDASSFTSCIRVLVSRYEELRESVEQARPDFDWSVDAEILLSLYVALE